jgi:hypothetical protein
MPLYDISNRTFHLPQKATNKLAEFISKAVSILEGSGSWRINRCWSFVNQHVSYWHVLIFCIE